MKNKYVLGSIIGIFTVASLALGGLGYLESKKEKKPEPGVIYNVTYKYYLNDVEQEQMPINPSKVNDDASSSAKIEKLYTLNTAKCTNNVTYKWDEESWTFATDNTADTTCSLYFVTTHNTLTMKVENAKIEKNYAESKIARGENAVIKITPNEGYDFEDVTCKLKTSNKEINLANNSNSFVWDKDQNTLTIVAINEETECTAKFKIANYNIEVKVENGSGATSVEYEYGKKVQIAINPADGYGNPSINCTNNQAAKFDNKTLTIDKLTNNTVCTVIFIKTQVEQKTFTVTLNIDADKEELLGGSNPATVIKDSGTASWTVNIKDGYSLDKLQCNSGSPVAPRLISGNQYTISINGVTENTECSLILKNNQQ